MSQMQLHHHQHYRVLPYRQIDEIDDKILEKSNFNFILVIFYPV